MFITIKALKAMKLPIYTPDYKRQLPAVVILVAAGPHIESIFR
jgi:hypothetical protein